MVRELVAALRRPASSRLLWGIALAAGIGAAALGWKWLTAVGAASVLVSVLPCVAMCALGICMHRRGGGSCHEHAPPNAGRPSAPETNRDL